MELGTVGGEFLANLATSGTHFEHFEDPRETKIASRGVPRTTQGRSRDQGRAKGYHFAFEKGDQGRSVGPPGTPWTFKNEVLASTRAIFYENDQIDKMFQQ